MLFLQGGKGSPIQSADREAASLQSAAVEASTMVIEALTDDLAPTDDDASMAVAERGISSLLEAKREIVVSLHFVDR
jgi:hypothetical protein